MDFTGDAIKRELGENASAILGLYLETPNVSKLHENTATPAAATPAPQNTPNKTT